MRVRGIQERRRISWEFGRKVNLQVTPRLDKACPKIIGTLGLAAASGAISGATEKKLPEKEIIYLRKWAIENTV